MRKWALAAGALGAAGLAYYEGQAPKPQLYGKTFFGTPGEGGLMALTYDDGPNTAWTPQLMELLDKHDVKATFFTIGTEVSMPYLVWTRLRPYVVILGLLLHSGIAIFMGLTLFSLLMMTMLLGYIPGATFPERLFSSGTTDRKRVSFDPKQPASVAAAARAVAWDLKGAVEPTAAN